MSRVLTMVTRARTVPGSGSATTLLKGLQAGDTRGQSVLHGYGNTGIINIGSTCGTVNINLLLSAASSNFRSSIFPNSFHHFFKSIKLKYIFLHNFFLTLTHSLS